MSQGRILLLPADVVSKIAAGEVVHRPASAVKEMLENCLDAGASLVRITTKEGGLKLIQIQDDGCGIDKEDLPNVCSRHATSKLSSFEELQSVSTFGFRGEALASISHVSHVTVTSATARSPCAYRAKYVDGVMEGEPAACAGRQGTVIVVEDLFYNVATRRKVLKYPRDEQHRIAEVVRKYALHYPSVGFVLKELEGSKAEVSTPVGSDTLDNISLLYGKLAKRDSIPITLDLQQYDAAIEGYITNGKWSNRKTVWAIFINGRLVESKEVRSAIDKAYNAVFSEAKLNPLVYLSLRIASEKVDVNVDPNKKNVHFLDEEGVAKALRAHVQDTLKCWKEASMEQQQLIQQTLLGSQSKRRRSPSKAGRGGSPKGSKRGKEDGSGGAMSEMEMKRETSVVVEHHLESIGELLTEVRKRQSVPLTRLWRHHHFIGLPTWEHALVQCEESIMAVEVRTFAQSFAYQYLLEKLEKTPHAVLAEPLPLDELVVIGLGSKHSGYTEDDGDPRELAVGVVDFLLGNAPLLQAYFALGMDAERRCLTTLPYTPSGELPSLALLPRVLLDIAYEPDWGEEKACFRDVANQLAKWFALSLDAMPLGVGCGGRDRRADEHNLLGVAQRVELAPDMELSEAFVQCAQWSNGMLWRGEEEGGRPSFFVQSEEGAWNTFYSSSTRQCQAVVLPGVAIKFFGVLFLAGVANAAERKAVLQQLQEAVGEQWKEHSGELESRSEGWSVCASEDGSVLVVTNSGMVFGDVRELRAFVNDTRCRVLQSEQIALGSPFFRLSLYKEGECVPLAYGKWQSKVLFPGGDASAEVRQAVWNAHLPHRGHQGTHSNKVGAVVEAPSEQETKTVGKWLKESRLMYFVPESSNAFRPLRDTLLECEP